MTERAFARFSLWQASRGEEEYKLPFYIIRDANFSNEGWREGRARERERERERDSLMREGRADARDVYKSE